MASKGNESRQVARRELKRMLAGYLHGKAGRIDINAMGDYLFDRMDRVPEAGCCRRCGDMCPNLVDGLCACCVNELEYEKREGGLMARIEETFDGRDWYMIECDDPNCEQRFDDGEWYADEDDLLNDARMDAGWQILYRDEHPELERDMHYCPAHRLPECATCTNIMADPAGWKDGQCPECIKEEISIERS